MLSDLIPVILALFLFSTAVGMSTVLLFWTKLIFTRLNNCLTELWSVERFLFKYVVAIDQYLENSIKSFLDSLAEADDTEEDIELLIFNRNMSTKLTKSDVLKKLKNANLTGYGYKKEVSYQSVMSPESTPYFKVSTVLL